MRRATDSRFSRRALLVQTGGLSCAVLTGPRLRAASAPALHLAASSTKDLVAMIRKPGDAAASTDALIEVFARSGIAVFDDVTTTPLNTPAQPISPLAYLRSQAAAMAAEIAAGNERPASAFDSLMPVTTAAGLGTPLLFRAGQLVEPRFLAADAGGAPPFADLYGGYFNGGDTPGADFARAALPAMPSGLAPIDTGQLPASTAAVGLMTGELLGQIQQQLPGIGNLPTAPSLPGLPDLPSLPASLNLPPLPAIDGSACGSAQRFVATVVQRVLSVLEAGASVAKIPILGAIAAGATTLAKLGIKIVFETASLIIAPVLGVLKAIGAGIGIATALLGSLTPWIVSVKAAPNRNRFGVGPLEYLTGEIDIAAGGADDVAWPPVVTDCAGAAGITLPARTSAGATVSLTLGQSASRPLIQLGKEPLVLDGHGRLAVTYQTENETEELARTGEQVVGIAYITATVQRDDLKQLGSQVLNLLLAEVPTLIADIIRPIVGPIVDEFRARLLSLAQAQGSTMLFVTHHEERPSTPVPVSTSATGFCLLGRFRAISANGPNLGVGVRSHSGDMIWEFRDDKTFRWSPDGYSYPALGGVVSWSGSASGTYALKQDTVLLTWVKSSVVTADDGYSHAYAVAELQFAWPSAAYRCGQPLTLKLGPQLLDVFELEPRPK